MDMDKNNLLRRLGNIHNELGVFYINQTGCMYKFCTYNNRYNKYLLFINEEIINFIAQYQQEMNELLNLPSVTTLLTHSLTHLESDVKARLSMTRRI